MAYELHDQALAALRNTGPELRNGAPNHAPMVIEALTVLGHDDAILPWIENFRPQLADDPRTSVVLDGEWEAALGDYTRLGAWQNLFRRELQSASWTDVLETWLPRLIPGSMASGTHGIIRCGHASRALANAVTPARLDELAKALAYCAARYRLVGGEPRLDGVLALEEATRQLPILETSSDRSGPPPRVVKRLNERPDFTAAVARLAPPSNVSVALSELAEIGARLYLHDAGRHPLVLLHTVTGPAAIQLIVANGSSKLAGIAFAYSWQALAAWASAYSRGLSADPLPTTAETWKTIIDLSVESGDDHAIKFAEACRRLERQYPSPVFRAAAADWVHRVVEARDWEPQQLVDAGIRTRLAAG
ncbi:questin oxidase family protein [Rhizobiales bacterium 3FA27D7]|jgi:hypothetical protein|uniref:questin oxidase family protein n=1 Tax=Mesorhizobium sp. 2RAF21 TaxID=3232995 RepID=UPI0010F6FED3